jgi:hypothetical protein
MAPEFKKRVEGTSETKGGYVHFTTGSKGEIFQIQPDTDKPAGAIGAVIRNGSMESPNATAIQIEMHYDPETVKETPSSEMLKATAKLIAKYSLTPLDFYAHWGVQPFDRGDVRFMSPDGEVTPTLLELIKYIKLSGSGAEWQKDEKEIAKKTQLL